MSLLRVIRGVACVAAFVVYSTSAVADATLEQASRLVEQGQSQAAYDLLKPLEEERAGDAEFDYVYGLSALDSGRPLEAVFALERAVDVAPQNGPARAELARAYLALGDTDDARSEFDKLNDMQLPSDVQQTVDRYISNIDQFHDASSTLR